MEWPGNLNFPNSVYLQWIICCAFHLDFLFFWLVISLRLKRTQMSSLISKIHVFLCRTNTSRCLLGKFLSATQAFLSVAPYIHTRCTSVSKIDHWELEVVGERVEYSINCTYSWCSCVCFMDMYPPWLLSILSSSSSSSLSVIITIVVVVGVVVIVSVVIVVVNSPSLAAKPRYTTYQNPRSLPMSHFANYFHS